MAASQGYNLYIVKMLEVAEVIVKENLYTVKIR